MSDEQRFPIQRDAHVRPAGSVSMAEAEKAYAAYSAQYGTDQSLKRLGERGGFGYLEITNLLGHEPTTWREGR